MSAHNVVMDGVLDDLAGSSAVLTIDLAALRANWRRLADMVAPAECAAVVKADAYGIGLAPAMHALAKEGARTFFVARLEEAIRARQALPEATIYVLDGLLGDPRVYCDHGLRPVLGSRAELERWAKVEARLRPPAALHIDTGMNRLGLSPHQIEGAASSLADMEIALVLSHFTSSEVPGAPDTERQIARFRGVADSAPRASLANSSGIFLASRPYFGLVRPGYALYGGNPTPDRTNPMQPVVTLEAPIAQIREIAAGEAVGYNNAWTAKRPSRIATIALGYADGIPRAAAGTDAKRGPDVVVGGVRCPIVGRISMDLMTIDITDAAPALAPGALVEVLGLDIGIDEFASHAGTIGYEILTGLGSRYRRIYKGA